MIEFKNISMQFKDTIAIDNLNLTIRSGEFVSILGPSGCGKSTTLFMLAGLLQPTRGQIIIDGNDVTHLKVDARNIGMVFQDYALYPHMTVFNNIAFPLKMKRLSKREIKEKVEYAAKLVEIDAYLNRLPKELSGGQQQRVAIARAIVREPEILLLDEPLSNLDARLRVSMREEIRAIQQRLNITTLFVTHDQEEALSISDKIVMLNEGKMMQYDTPFDMYNHPKHVFVATFIGRPPMNILKLDEHQSKQLNPELNIDIDTTIGIRPEHIIITEQGYPVIIKRAEILGKDIVVTAEDAQHRQIKYYTNTNPLIGNKVYLTAALENIHLFDSYGNR
ncbi:ABC transporter ATP-binding protein [Macrococcoides goetzii]|nr:ABC transporter ATP-binding protein [Macrococcus goetzii]TDM45359.1 ABC transporter ATP-binding protein [Macrococcus goetzii]